MKTNANTQFGIANLLEVTEASFIEYENEFVLFDNLKCDAISAQQHEEVLLHYCYPFKVELVFVVICIEGNLQGTCDMKEFNIHKGDTLIVIKDSLCNIKSFSTDFKTIIIGINNEQYYEGMNKSNQMLFYQYFTHTISISISKETNELILFIYKQMFNLLSDPKFQFKKEALLGYMSVLIAYAEQWIYDYYQMENSTGKRSSQIFKEFSSLIRQYCTKERDLDFYADKMCISKKYLSQTIQKESNYAAKHWIQSNVIMEAQALLKTGKYNTQEVADLLNFPNAASFCKFFKKETGISPRQYMLS